MHNFVSRFLVVVVSKLNMPFTVTSMILLLSWNNCLQLSNSEGEDLDIAFSVSDVKNKYKVFSVANDKS